MTPSPSFVTANFVARQIGYRMEKGWMQGDDATNAWFSPLATFEERFGEMLREIKALGFSSIDLWCAHLHWRWATLEHVAVAKRLLAELGLVVRSYPAWVGGGAAELRGACRLCRDLNIPLFAGHCEYFAQDRAAAVVILREFGVAYAIENHPEKNAAEIFARLGDGDEDVVGVALDTGWCATQGWDALAAVNELGPRLLAVHLKDVKAKRAEKTGLTFVDMGHETCRAGDGIVPLQAIVGVLREREFRGPIGIEHEPEEFNPDNETRESRERVEQWWDAVEVRESAPPLRVVVVGCGNIAGGYGEAMLRRPEIKIIGASDIDHSRTVAWTQKFGGYAYPSLDDVLADPQIEAVVNLTIQHAHVDVITQCLNAGKHVHTEKPLASTYAEARALVELADSRGLRLSCAPVTWLGEAQQTAWKLIRDGAIGTPRVVYANVDWARIETWHPNPVPFYAAGPVFDVGVYPLTLLTAWFGPVVRVTTGGGIVLPERRTKAGEIFELKTEDWLVSVLEFANGVRARLTANFYVGEPAENRAGLEIHGDAGSVSTAWFSGAAPVRHGKFGGSYHPVIPVRPSAGFGDWYCDWSAGVVGLWRGLRTNTAHPTSGAQGAHVVEIMEAVHRSAREGKSIALVGSFTPPAPQPWAMSTHAVK
ncbi:MAG TPA: Gfo/Idh/MocA family oxidoreductase [Lacunisphaera sp.]|jgi:predicted dehydrogenase/sugar phosphate isomerase/epimerase